MHSGKLVLILLAIILTSSLLIQGTVAVRVFGEEPIEDESTAGVLTEDDSPFIPPQYSAEMSQKAQKFLESQEKKYTVIPKTVPKDTKKSVSTYTVTPVLFLSADKTSQSTDSVYINEAFQVIQKWYSGPLESDSARVFTLNQTIQHTAPENFEYYKCPNNEYPCGDDYSGVWGNVEKELRDAGFPLLETGTIYIIFVPGAGGFAGSLGCNETQCVPGPSDITSTRGFAMLGDWALDGIAQRPNTQCTQALGIFCTRDPQRGAIAHELGHTLGLVHPTDTSQNTLMATWWNFPFVTLLENEKSRLSTSQFFKNTPCTLDSKAITTKMRKKVAINFEFTAKTRLENDGFCKWKNETISLKLEKDKVWKIKKVPLTKDVYPAQYYDFSIPLTSPSTVGQYNNLWKLYNGSISFGDRIGRKVNVIK